ncbi:hypothetical protein [Nitrobacter winogradskyi]|nr:hypothetical protein [Nitrobacter winogradskyi]
MTENQNEQSKAAEDQKPKPAQQPEPDDPLGSGCGFMPGEGI